MNQTLGLVFSLDLKHKTSTLLKKLYDPAQALYADSQGSLSLLPNGNTLMGYGQIPVIREYGPSGDLRLDIAFGDINGTQSSYRAFRYEWEAVPAAAPVVAVHDGRAYMSWNGATGVRSWEIYEGTDPRRLRRTAVLKSSGFETQASISASTKFVKVGAVTAGNSGRYSAVISV